MDREQELGRLERLLLAGGGLAALYGRCRIGKTRLLVEWLRRHDGVYGVADRSAPDVQRSYLETRPPQGDASRTAGSPVGIRVAVDSPRRHLHQR